MSSIEPRLNPSQGRNGAPGDASSGAAGHGTNGSGRGSGAAGGNGRTAAGTVTVAAGVENALAAVQQQLARQAATITLEPPAPAPVAPVVAPVAAPSVAPVAPPVAPVAPPVLPAPPAPAPPPVAYRDPAVVAVPVGRAVRDDDELDWYETRPRRVRPVVDPDDLTKEERRALGKLKARKVRRIIRHVSPWSVFKVSILFYLCLWMILMVAGVILWKVGQEAGVLTNVEKFYAKASGEKVFEIDGRQVFRAASSAGVILVFAGTGFTVLLAVLFNLITDLTGGVRVSVLELENTRRVIRRGARGERLKAKAAADADGELDELDEQREDGLDDGDPDGRPSLARPAAVTRRVPAVRPSSQPTVEFAADAIVDGRGELDSSSSASTTSAASSAPALPARGRGARGESTDAAFAPQAGTPD